jgi:predicted AlkP superfamily pyrophosphatase or phosphodiesterase
MKRNVRRFSARVVIALAGVALPAWSQPQAAGPRAVLQIVLVLDGLRPDSINAQDTPNLFRLRTEGVTFANSHAVFPTVTRVNATSIATGSYPGRHGIMGNSIYVPAVEAKRAFTNDDAKMLLRLEDRIVTAPGLADVLQAEGHKYVAVSSGSTGSALLLAPRSPRGVGIVFNGDFAPGEQAAFPKEAGVEVLKRFGPAPKKGGATMPYDESAAWAMKVLNEYVLPEMKPRVVISWMTEPDHIQHGMGAGSPAAVASIRRDDALVGALLGKLAALGLQDRTDIMVVSDHGFGHTVHNVNVAQELKDAGLLPREESDEVVIASSGQAMAVHVKDRDPAKIAAIVDFLQRRPWCGLIFTAAGRGAPHEGTVPGTFSLEYVHLGGHERSPDIVFTFPWSSARNRHGVPGTDYNIVASGVTAAVSVDTANHGGIGPWTVRNTMLAWGPDFKRGTIVRTPASNVDVAPTILHLLGLTRAAAAMQGRPLLEALAGGPDEEQVPMETRTLQTSRGDYRAVLQVSEVAGRRYVDKGWRLP